MRPAGNGRAEMGKDISGKETNASNAADGEGLTPCSTLFSGEKAAGIPKHYG